MLQMYHMPKPSLYREKKLVLHMSLLLYTVTLCCSSCRRRSPLPFAAEFKLGLTNFRGVEYHTVYVEPVTVRLLKLDKISHSKLLSIAFIIARMREGRGHGHGPQQKNDGQRKSNWRHSFRPPLTISPRRIYQNYARKFADEGALLAASFYIPFQRIVQHVF